MLFLAVRVGAVQESVTSFSSKKKLSAYYWNKHNIIVLCGHVSRPFLATNAQLICWTNLIWIGQSLLLLFLDIIQADLQMIYIAVKRCFEWRCLMVTMAFSERWPQTKLDNYIKPSRWWWRSDSELGFDSVSPAWPVVSRELRCCSLNIERHLPAKHTVIIADQMLICAVFLWWFELQIGYLFVLQVKLLPDQQRIAHGCKLRRCKFFGGLHVGHALTSHSISVPAHGSLHII